MHTEAQAPIDPWASCPMGRASHCIFVSSELAEEEEAAANDEDVVVPDIENGDLRKE